MRRRFGLVVVLLVLLVLAPSSSAQLFGFGSGNPPPAIATQGALACPSVAGVGARRRVLDQGGAVYVCRSSGWVAEGSGGGDPIPFSDVQAGTSTSALVVGAGGDLDWTDTGSINARRTANTRYSRSLADWENCLETGDGARRCVLTAGRYDAGAGLELTPGTSSGGANGSLIHVACDGATIYSSAADVSAGGGGAGAVVSLSLSTLQHDTEVVISGCRIDGSNTDTNETGLYLSSSTGFGGASGRVRIEGVSIGESGLQEGTERGLWYDRTGLAYTLVMSDSRVQAAGVVFDWEFGARGMITNTLFNTIGTASGRCFDWGSGNAVTDSYAGFLSLSGVRLVGCGAGALRTKTGLVIGDVSIGGLIGSAASDEPVWTVSDGNMLDVQVGYQGNANEGTAGPLIYMEADDLTARVTLTEAGCQYLTLGPEIFEGAAGVVPRSLSAEVASGAVACSGGVPFGDTLLAEDRTGSRGLVRLHGRVHEYIGNTAPVVVEGLTRALSRLVFGSSTGTSPNVNGCLATALTAYQTDCAAGVGATNQSAFLPAGTRIMGFACAPGEGLTLDPGETVDYQVAYWDGDSWENVSGATVQLANGDTLGDLKDAAPFAAHTLAADSPVQVKTPAFVGTGFTMDQACALTVAVP